MGEVAKGSNVRREENRGLSIHVYDPLSTKSRDLFFQSMGAHLSNARLCPSKYWPACFSAFHPRFGYPNKGAKSGKLQLLPGLGMFATSQAVLRIIVTNQELILCLSFALRRWLEEAHTRTTAAANLSQWRVHWSRRNQCGHPKSTITPALLAF